MKIDPLSEMIVFRMPWIADNVGHVELSILSDRVCSGYRYEVGRLSQAVHDDPYRVVPTRGLLVFGWIEYRKQ
jgi:hypothetical protein